MAASPELRAHQEWLGFLHPVGLVVSAPALVANQAFVNRDIVREQQDLKVVVVPELNAGTASLIATAINPAIGLGTFLAQFLLREPLQSATTQQFHISGGWADPKVEKIEKK